MAGSLAPTSTGAEWRIISAVIHSARDVGEAGRELGRFDSRPWLSGLTLPSAVVVTSKDEAVPPSKQRELASALGAPLFEAPINHIEVTVRPEAYNPALLAAIATVRAAAQPDRERAQAGAFGYA